MELNVTTKKENKLLQRNEVEGELTFTGATPKYDDVRAALAQKLNVAADTIAIQHVYTSFGAQKAKVTAHVYSSKEQLEKIEPKKKEKKAAPGAPAAEAKV